MFLNSFNIAKMMVIASLFVSGLWASGSHKHNHHDSKKEASHHIKGTQKVCPVSKKKIDPSIYIDFQGQRVYFCCPGCDKKFLKNSESRFTEMKDRGERAENIQKVCPVSGDPLEDHEISVDLPGRKIYFCCKRCIKSFNKNKKKYLSQIGHKKGKKENKHDDHHGHDHSHHHH